MSVLSTIGDRIKAVRLRAGLPQKRFATALSYSERALINWEQNAAEPPIAILPKLRLGFDVDPEWVVLGQDNEPRRQYGRTDWARFDRIARDVDLVCDQVGLELKPPVRTQLIRDLFDDGPDGEEENRAQLRVMLKGIALERGRR